MAEKKEQTVVEKKNERVAVSLDRGAREPAFISVNGVGYLIPTKGTHMVPPEIAAELERSRAAQDAADENAYAMQQAAQQQAAQPLRRV